MTWIDEQPEKKVEAALTAFRTALATGEHRATSCMKYGNNNERFALWLSLADRSCTRLVEVGIFDLADANWRDMFDAGDAPREAVREALEADDLYGALLANLEA